MELTLACKIAHQHLNLCKEKTLLAKLEKYKKVSIICGSITTPAMGLVPCEKGGVASQTIGTEPKRRPTWAGLRLYLTP